MLNFELIPNNLKTIFNGADSLARAEVEGGWMVVLIGYKGAGGLGGMAFFPDPDHAWTID